MCLNPKPIVILWCVTPLYVSKDVQENSTPFVIYRARINAEKSYAEKTTQKMDFTEVKIA